MNFQNLEDLATSFHNSLLVLARAPVVKSIILIGHSLGGLIVKQVFYPIGRKRCSVITFNQALILLSKSKNEEDQRLLRAVYGIVFFGVPHSGLDIASLIPMVGDHPNRCLNESLSHNNSQILNMQRREFHEVLGKEGDSEIVCFYETVRSPTAEVSLTSRHSATGSLTNSR